MREFSGYKKGINLGGWLSQCGEGNYNEQHYTTFITETDIKKISLAGCDHVRLPVDYNVIQSDNGEFIESGFAHIDRCILWCRKYGLKIVLDLHKTMGYVFDDKSYCSFFYNDLLQDNFVLLWREIAKRYARHHEFLSFELLNEITGAELSDTWNKVSAKAIKAIREVSDDVKIIIGGIFNSSIYGLTLLLPPTDKNIVFTFHCYSPLIFTHQAAYWVENMPRDINVSYPLTADEYKEKSSKVFGSDFDGEFQGLSGALSANYFEHLFAPAIEISEKYDVPLYCGEYGVIDYADEKSTLQWFYHINAAFEKYGIPRAVWTYKSMNFGITDSHYTAILPEIIKAL